MRSAVDFDSSPRDKLAVAAQQIRQHCFRTRSSLFAQARLATLALQLPACDETAVAIIDEDHGSLYAKVHCAADLPIT